MKKVVLLDVDNVLANFVDSYLDLVEEVTGRRFSHDSMDRWELSEACNLSPKEKREVEEHISDEHFCETIHPYPSAREGVELLREIADVRAVTSPWHSSPFWCYERGIWLVECMGFSRDHIIQTSDKAFIWGDVFVDDKLEHLDKWRDHWNVVFQDRDDIWRGRPVLWNHPVNRNDVWGGVRTNDWKVLRELVEKL